MRPANFSYTCPTTLAEALLLTARGARPLAGGQTLMAALRQREINPAALVDIRHIGELSAALSWHPDHLAIGALVTHAQLLADVRVAPAFPWLTQAARALGDVQVRNRGTTLGNVCWADPRANMLVALLASDAVVLVQGAADALARRVALEDLITGFRTTNLGGALALSLAIPRRVARGIYREFSRQRQDLALVNLCVVRGEGHARVVFGGLDQRPRRLPQLEALLASRPLHETLTTAEYAALFQEVSLNPPLDAHGSPEWKQQIARELLRRALTELTELPEAADHG